MVSNVLLETDADYNSTVFVELILACSRGFELVERLVGGCQLNSDTFFFLSSRIRSRQKGNCVSRTVYLLTMSNRGGVCVWVIVKMGSSQEDGEAKGRVLLMGWVGRSEGKRGCENLPLE